MTTFMECPRKYQLQIIEGWVGKRKRIELEFGILFHAVLEKFHKLQAEGTEENAAILQSVRWLLQHGRSMPEDDTGYRTLFTLLRAFVWYTDRFRNDHNATIILPDGKPAAELSFRIALPLVSPDGEPYLYCGHIDRATTFAGETFIDDYKTTKSSLSSYYFKQFDTSWQITGYIFAGQTLLPDAPFKAIIDGVQLAIGFSRFDRKITERTTEQLNEWLTDFMLWIMLAERYANADYWPMNRASCTHYGGCPFIGVCSKSGKENRELVLKTDFEKQPWNPLRNR